MAGEYDLSIVGRDLAFGPDDEPLYLTEGDAVAQDVKHRLEEKGLTADLVADDAPTGGTLRRIAREVEEDTRIAPGTATADRDGGTITVQAVTLGGESVPVSVAV